MDNEELNKTGIDSLFEKARQADPVLNGDEARNIISNAEGIKFNAKKSEAMRNNRYRLLIAAGLLLLLWAGYQFLRKETKQEPDKANVSLQEIKPPPHESIENNELPMSSGEHEEKRNDFPPVYKEENISRPPDVEKDANRVTPKPSEKTKTQTNGPAAITFIHEDKNITLTLFLNEVKSLSIDGVLIDPQAYAQYATIIEAGKKLEGNSRKENDNTSGLSEFEREQNRQNEIIMNSIIKALARDGLITDDQSFDFRLIWDKLLIDGLQQSQEYYEKYRALYEEASGKKLTKTSNVHIKH